MNQQIRTSKPYEYIGLYRINFIPPVFISIFHAFLTFCIFFVPFVTSFFIIILSVQAHTCGPSELAMRVGEKKSWQITADRTEGPTSYTPILIGDPSVAMMEPSAPFIATDGVFTFTAVGSGETRFAISWFFKPTLAEGVCEIIVRVTEDVTINCPDSAGTEGIFRISPESCLDCLTLEQINFDFPRGFKMENTNWGGIEANPIALLDATGMPKGFLNMWTDTGWVLQNLSLDIKDGTKISTYFTLFGDTENPSLENESLPREGIEALITYSGDFLTTSFAECLKKGIKDTFPLKSGIWDAQGVGTASVTLVAPPSPPHEPPIISGTVTPERFVENNPVNIEASVNQCFPMSVANSLQFLEDSFKDIKDIFKVPNDHKPGQDGDDSLVGQLDKESGRKVISRHSKDNKGVFANDMFKGKFSYLKKNGLEKRLQHKHQGDERGTFPSGNFTSDGITSKNEGSNVTFDWLRQEIKAGEDVELVYEWSVGTSTGSHAVRVVGFETTVDGKNKIYYAHDRIQQIDGVGLTVDCEEVRDSDGDLKLEIAPSNPTMVRKITFAMSESVIPCDFECEITSSFSGFKRIETNFLIKGDTMVPINQQLFLKKGQSAQITVKIFSFCPGEDKKEVATLVLPRDRGNLLGGPPLDLDITPLGGGTSPVTFTISCKSDSLSVSVLTFHVTTPDGIKILCGLEVICNEGSITEPPETPTPTPIVETPSTPTLTPTPTSTPIIEIPPTPTPIVETPPTPTPIIPRRPPTPTLTPTSTPTLTPTPTPTSTPTPTPTPTGPCFIYFSIEEPHNDHGNIFVSNEWGIELPPGVNRIHLNGQGASLLPGGTNEELLEKFLSLQDKEVGLDGFDILELDKSPAHKHKIIFTVEKDFTVDNQNHPLSGKIVTEGDLLLTNGGVIKNQVLIDLLDLFTQGEDVIIPVKSLGIDAIEVEGFLKVFDAFENKVIEDLEGFINTIGSEQRINIIFSFEDINEEFLTGSRGLLPAGILVSADDLIEYRFSNGLVSTRIIRSGADGIPAPAPDILEKCEEDKKLGLDAACTCLPEDKVFDELENVWFSTSLDSPSNVFTHGDILHHNLQTGCEVFLTNSELTDSAEQIGLDGLDFFPDTLPTQTPVSVVTTVTVNPTTQGSSLRRLLATVTVLDQHGVPMKNVIVTATVDADSGPDPVVSPTSARTDSNGEAEFDFRFPFRTSGGRITFTADGRTATITQR